MPLPLHRQLKRKLDCDESDPDPADAVESDPRCHVGPEEQAAKRQRIERIAAQYLRGRVPVILTASLRGPFGDGWKNPWAEEKRPKRKPKVPGGPRQKAGSSRQGPTRPSRSASRADTAVQTTRSPQAVASPEASRSRSADAIKSPPATAPSPPEYTFGTANSYTADTTRCIRSRSPMTNPFWLRRPEPDGQLDIGEPTDGNAEKSPTGSRSLAYPDRRRTLQLVQPKTALGHRAQQRGISPANDIRSSASASMVISSPVKALTQRRDDDASSHTLQPQEPSAGTVGPSPSTFADAQSPSASATMPLGTPLTGPATTASELVTKPELVRTLQQEKQKRLSREVIHRSAECLVDLLKSAPSSTTLSKQTNEGAVGETNEWTVSEALPRVQSSLVASPAPTCSSGFVYKKVGTRKWTIDNAPRSKPRAVHLNSSPASKVGARSEPHSQRSKKSETDGSDEQQSMGSAQSSRQSAMSTQAAMLLAQLEFQESTFPMSPLDTPRPWSQGPEETRQPGLPEPSPAITPLSVFRPQLEQGHGMASVLRGPMMSTQDLFAAASPFAMSTVKKKAAGPERSNTLTTAKQPWTSTPRCT